MHSFVWSLKSSVRAVESFPSRYAGMSDSKSAHPRICSVVLLVFIVFKFPKSEFADDEFSAAAKFSSDICWLIRAHTRVADCSMIESLICSSRMPCVVSSMIASKSFLLSFMMFLQITADLFAQARSGAVQRDRDDHLRHT